MNAIQFIKEHGVEKARKVIEGALEEHNKFDIDQNKTVDVYKTKANLVDLRHIKRIVESVDLVKRYGGIAEAKTIHNDEFWCEIAFERLEQAIADYELIYGGEHV
ncbi:hypothetical protein [Acinetobacter sp. ANC5681]|uniref:hypothetical protein n=1 Tax=Acinetobacter sp. ANC5681 TaxID=2929504 RepID=UPI00201B10D3|nr:hypothetical protein [Acinetobacter sp. ANC5681]MCL5767379.1 hypothetical protein [Acinetobacter sp. ANC5681]